VSRRLLPGRRLVVWRAENDVSQADLAVRLGVHQSTVAKWEGQRYAPSPAHRVAIERETGREIPASAWATATTDVADEKVEQYIGTVLGGMCWGVLLWPSSHLGYLLGGMLGFLAVVARERELQRRTR
jgi:transcriptional regulator with XRE-family HTH domain